MRVAAQIISHIFHPIFMISYGVLALYLINPYLFSVPDPKALGILLIYVFLLSVFFPVLSISLMRSLGFVKSLHMQDRKDRVGPLICTAIFYLWLYINIYSNPSIPTPFSIFVLGSVIALFIAFFMNNFTKISLHSVGVGGALVGILFIKFNYSYNSFILGINDSFTYSVNVNLLVILVILMVGAVATSRLILKSHRPKDIYGGLVVGAFAQTLAIAFLN